MRILLTSRYFQERKKNDNSHQNIYPLMDAPPHYDSIVHPISIQPSAPAIPVEVPIQQPFAPGYEPIRMQPTATTNLSGKPSGMLSVSPSSTHSVIFDSKLRFQIFEQVFRKFRA